MIGYVAEITAYDIAGAPEASTARLDTNIATLQTGFGSVAGRLALLEAAQNRTTWQVKRSVEDLDLFDDFGPA